MSRYQKQSIIDACRFYEEYCKQKAEEEAAKGNLDGARDFRSRYNAAAVNVYTFSSILDEPAGSVKI